MARLEETLVAARLYEEGDAAAERGEDMLGIQVAAAVDGLVRNNPGQKKEDVESGVSEADGAFLRCHSKALFDVAPLAVVALSTLDPQSTQVRDIGPLRGAPLTSLTLNGTNVVDLAVLKGMGLRFLNLGDTEVADIRVLQGMPLEFLHIGATKVSDISVLAGMPLKQLYLSQTSVRDISVLKGMPLQQLTLAGTPIRDISVLRGAPLQTLDAYGCKELHDLRPLADCRKLEQLSIPAHCTDIEFLRKLPALKVLDNSRTLYETKQTAAEFWGRWDAGRARRGGGE